MKQILPFLLGILPAMYSFSQTGLPPDPEIWFKGDNSQLNAKVWHDVSGKSHHAIPSSGNMPDTFSYLNFNKCFSLPEGDYFIVPSLSIKKDRLTTIIVYQAEDSITEQSVWSFQPDKEKRVGLTTQHIISESSSIKYSNLTQTFPVINSLSQSWKDEQRSLKEGTFYIASCDSIPYNGKIAECFVFDGNLPDSVLNKYLSYLAIKYGITLYQTNYHNSKGELTWNYEDNRFFSHSIVGLGKDKKLGLDQKQTYLAGKNIIIGLEQYAGTNEDNYGFIYDNNFLVWGLDSSGVNLPGNNISWNNNDSVGIYVNGLLQANGEKASELSTFMMVDASGWQGDLYNYFLLIDRSGTGDFNMVETDMYIPGRLDEDSILHFSNIRWDIDGNGYDRFCFAYIRTDSIPDDVKDLSGIISLSNPDAKFRPVK